MFTENWSRDQLIQKAYLRVNFLLIKYTCHSKSQTLRTRYPFRSTGRPISHRNGWSFRVYRIPLRSFARGEILSPVQQPGWTLACPRLQGSRVRWIEETRRWTHAGVTRTGMTFCRAMRGNWSDLAPARKSPRCHVKTLLVNLLSLKVKRSKRAKR